MSTLLEGLRLSLTELRDQGMRIPDINPVSALADMLSDKLYSEQLDIEDIDRLLDELADNAWQGQASALADKAQLAQHGPSLTAEIVRRLAKRPLGQSLYRAVFTAHPVFALRKEASDALVSDAHRCADGSAVSLAGPGYQPRLQVTLAEEHDEAMQALRFARTTIRSLNDSLLSHLAETDQTGWREALPCQLGVSSWVGYDLDGRADITWLDTLTLRLKEKIYALADYIRLIEQIDNAGLSDICARFEHEYQACQADISRFEALDDHAEGFAEVFDAFTHREGKLTDSAAIAAELHEIARKTDDNSTARSIMVLAADIATHGFGMGEVHLRINAVQLRNAMRSIDGRSLTQSDGSASSRLLMERLAKRIKTEAEWQINFGTVDAEVTTARRQLMLAAQFIKHIDSSQPIRLLIAECERPITYLSALYLAHKLGLSDHLDISPLFETSFGLEHGASMMAQLFEFDVVTDYIRRRRRVAIQTGFSDAGRFMGQLAANLAIERLQIKMLDLCADTFGSDAELLIFNTHGESLGRGGAGPNISDRQAFIMTPFVRARAQERGVPLYHQSSFQGGDGYRLFGSQRLADASLCQLVLSETGGAQPDWQNDPFYAQHDFSLDLFLSLKNWHETLFSSDAYGLTLDVFGANLLPKTGSRPAKRVVQAGSERADPSKMRAIPHNAILQQLGYLAVVISGIGSAATIDADRFSDIYARSPRLKQLIAHVKSAKSRGSLNTMLAYARLMDNGFWIGRAYHGNQDRNQRSFRVLASHLGASPHAMAIRQTVWRLRNDLIDLYRLFNLLDEGSVRTTGADRLELDILHALRLTIITDSLLTVAKVPRFAESNRYSNRDLITAALRLDFDLVCEIIEVEFPLSRHKSELSLAEPEHYADAETAGYDRTRQQLLEPLYAHRNRLRLITQMISAHYGAHG